MTLIKLRPVNSPMVPPATKKKEQKLDSVLFRNRLSLFTNCAQHVWKCDLPVLHQLNNSWLGYLKCELSNVVLKCKPTNLCCQLFVDAKLLLK